MSDHELFAALAVLAVSAGLVAAGAALYPRLRTRLALARLRPIALQGIIYAYRISIWAANATGQALNGADRKAWADSIYDAIPPGWITSLISREQFSGLVQAVFDELAELGDEFTAQYTAAFDAWLAEQSAQPAHRP